MTTESLIKVLGDLNQLENVTLEELTGLRDQFPYSQNFQVLVAKKKQLLGRDDSDEAFHNLSNYIVNKNHLYDRFAESEAESPDTNTQSSSLDKLIDEELFSGQERNMEEEITAELESTEKIDPPLEETIQLELPEEVPEIQNESKFITVSDIEDSAVIPVERRAEEAEDSEEVFTDEKINKEEIEQDDELDFITVKPVKLPKNKAVKRNKKRNKTKKPDHKMKSKKKKEKAEKKKKKAIKSAEKKIAKQNKKKREEKAKEIFTENLDSFTSWLASLNPSKSIDFKSEEKALPTPDAEVKLVKAEPKTKKKKKKSSKKKKKLQNKIDSSQQRKSVVVSETLAKIMANQGHIKQSIDIYKQLMLLYPEKSGYFASQIKKLD
ncbi:hypothetical protein N9B82_02975 [Saprospiraceae bacterium]|nr:hypothetical protein [Saprospiraceae bacterium]